MSLGRYYRRIVVVPQGLFDPDQVNVIEVSIELRDEPVVIAAPKHFGIRDSIASLDLITRNCSSDKIRPKTGDAYVDHKAEAREAETYVRTERRNEQSQTSGDRAVKEWLDCCSSSCSGFLTPYDVEIVLGCMSNMHLPIGDEDGHDMMTIPMQQVLSRITEASEHTHSPASFPKEPADDDNHAFEATSSTATYRSSTSEVTGTKKSASFTIVPSTNTSRGSDPTTGAHKRLRNISSPIVAAESSAKEVVFETNSTDFAAETSSESFATTAGSTKAVRVVGVASGKDNATETQEERSAEEEKMCCTLDRGECVAHRKRGSISSGHVKEVRCDIELYLNEVENLEIRQLHRDLTNYQLARRRCFLGCHGMNEGESNSR